MAYTNRILTIYTFFFFIIMTTSVVAQSSLTPDERTRKYLKNFRDDYEHSLLKSKAELMRKYWADDIRLMTEFQKTMVGKENVLSYYEAFTNRFRVESCIRRELEVLDLSSRIVEHGIFELTLVLKGNDKRHHLKGGYENIWKKFDDGHLELITDGWNYNHQTEIGDALRFEGLQTLDVARISHVFINDNTSLELAAYNSLLERVIVDHDATTWAQFYTEDAIVFSRRHGIYTGRKAIEEHLGMHVKELPVFEKLALRNDKIDHLGPFIIEYASNIAIWRSGNSSGVGQGKDLRIWKREPDGALKIFRHIGMYD